MREFPDQFIIATATLYHPKRPTPPNEQPHRPLEQQPPDLTRQVGLENPRRLFKPESPPP